MQARGPLMIEHRLIEQMFTIIEDALAKIESKHEIDPVLVDTAVDFIRVYADQTHHGKEEDILFRELDKKPLRENDRQIMNELIERSRYSVARQPKPLSKPIHAIVMEMKRLWT